MLKKQVEKLNKIKTSLIIIIIILILTAFSLSNQNKELKDQIKDLNAQYEKGVSQGTNDFALFVMGRLQTCDTLTLKANDASMTVVDTACVNK